MGDNAQTSVPKFTSGDVLTAANTNLLSNGIPVFSGTATRNDAFGGTGEKVLAEGQFAFLEDSNTTQFYDGAAWLSVGGKVAQVVTATSSTQVSSNSTSYVTSGLAVTITPTSNTSKIFVTATTGGRNDTGSFVGVYTIFRGTVADTNLGDATNGMTSVFSAGGNTYGQVAPSVLDSPATTSATTYTLGMKSNNAGGSVYAQAAFLSGTGSFGSITAWEISA